MSKKYALCVTISEYADPKNNLSGVKNDIPAITKILTDNGFHDLESIRDKNATLGNIQKGLEQLVRQRSSGDICVFYYSGHGVLLPKEFSQTDDPDGQDEAIVTYDCSLSTLLLDNWIAQYLKASLPKDVSFWGFYDCCHSGDIYKVGNVTGLTVYEQTKELSIADIYLDSNPTYIGKSSDKEIKSLVIDDSLGRSFHFGAAEPDKPALCKEIDGVKRSVFTWALAEVIKPYTSLTIEQAEQQIATRVASQTSIHTPQVASNKKEKGRVLFT